MLFNVKFIVKIILKFFWVICSSWLHKLNNIIINLKRSSHKPPISVILTCFKDDRSIKELFDTVINQTIPVREIIVVAEDSSEIRNFQKFKPLKNPKIKWYFRDGGQLIGSHRNYGINKSKGEFVCCLNSADRLSPTFLEKCLFRLERENQDVCGSWSDAFDRQKLPPKTEILNLKWLQETKGLPSIAVFRKIWWNLIGGYTESMAEGYVDRDFWVRMAKFGARFITIEEPLFSPDLKKVEKLSESRPENQKKSLPNPQKTGSDQEEKQIRVLIALPFLTVGGAEVLVSQICRYLAGGNFRFTVITTIAQGVEHGNTAPLFEQSTHEIYDLPHFLDPSEWKAFIFYLLESRSIDLIWQIGSSYVYDLLPEIKTRFPKLKIMDFLFNEVGHTASNRKYNYCIDLTLTENKPVEDWLLAHGETGDRIRCFPSGVDLSQFSPVEDKKVIRRRLGITADFLAGYCGRFSDEKYPEMFIEIADRFRDREDIEFLMTGAGPLIQKVQSQIVEYNLINKIHFFGTVPDVKPYLGVCDALVLPSKLDGRPTAVLQALAMGVPVICSDVGALPDIIQDKQNGFLCRSGNINQFVEAIRLLASDSSLRVTCCREARCYAETELDANKYLSEIEFLLKSLVHRAD